jgi:hypothetical protein
LPNAVGIQLGRLSEPPCHIIWGRKQAVCLDELQLKHPLHLALQFSWCKMFEIHWPVKNAVGYLVYDDASFSHPKTPEPILIIS